MSLGAGASYYRTGVVTSDPFQFAPGRYASSDGLKFDACAAEQSGMMYNDRGRGTSFMAGASFSSARAPAFDVRCGVSVSGYEYVPSPTYTGGHSVGEYGGIKTPLSAGEVAAVSYGHALDRVHCTQSAIINHAVTSPQPALQPGFAIYPWMRSVTAGKLLLDYIRQSG